MLTAFIIWAFLIVGTLALVAKDQLDKRRPSTGLWRELYEEAYRHNHQDDSH